MAVHLSAFGPEMGGFRASSMSRSSVMMILLLLLVGPTFSFTMNEIEAKKQLEAMRIELAEKELVVESLRGSLPGNLREGTCSAEDHQCRNRERRGHLKKNSATSPERLKLWNSMKVVTRAKATVIRWLPFQDVLDGSRINRLLAVGDAKGYLHIFSREGELLASQDLGHRGAVTSMAVSRLHEAVCRVVTGGNRGDIRIHTIKSFEPAKAEAFPLLGPSILASGGENPKVSGIAHVELLPKGRSFSILAADENGRVSVHLRNGSVVATDLLVGNNGDRELANAVAVSKTWAAIAHGDRISFYDGNSRKLTRVRCMALPTAVNRASEKATEEIHPTEKGERRIQRRLKQIEAHVTSLALDWQSQNRLYAGTADGRVLVLDIKHNQDSPRCKVLHDMDVQQDSKVMSVNVLRGGYLAALAHGHTVASINIYNTTKLRPGKSNIPGLVHYQPLGRSARSQFRMSFDERSGLAVLVDGVDIHLFVATLPYQEPPDWAETMFRIVRSPGVFAAVAGLMLWLIQRWRTRDIPAGMAIPPRSTTEIMNVLALQKSQDAQLPCDIKLVITES